VDFFEDYLTALRWFLDPDNKAEAVEIVARFMKQQPEALGYVFTQSDFYRDPDALPNAAMLQAGIDVQKDLGFIQESIDVGKYIDDSLVKEAAARLAK